MTRLTFVSLLVALLTGCGTAAGSRPVPPEAPTQWTGPHSGVERASTRVVRDAAAWVALWQQLGREAPQEPAWSSQMAVAVFLGERRTAGYRIEVVDTREASGRLVITCREHVPARDKMVAQVLTSPWAVIVVPTSTLPVVTRPLSADR